MFSIADRNRVRDHVLERAKADVRIVAGAVVGSLAKSEGDRWSDLDLTFGVADGVAIREVLDDFTADLGSEFDATHLFDLPSGAAIYRVFLLPGCLQFDLSFAPASQFGALGQEFRLLFGQATQQSHGQAPPARQLLGYAVHHALRARLCIERGRYWQAEYWVSGVRDYALSLACVRRGLPAHHGRGSDALPNQVRNVALGALVLSKRHGKKATKRSLRISAPTIPWLWLRTRRTAFESSARQSGMRSCTISCACSAVTVISLSRF